MLRGFRKQFPKPSRSASVVFTYRLNSANFARTGSEGARAAAINDIVSAVSSVGGKMPLKKLLQLVKLSTKLEISSCGKGLEGYLKQHSKLFQIEGAGAEKVVCLLKGEGSTTDAGGADGQNTGERVPPAPVTRMKPRYGNSSMNMEIAIPVADPSTNYIPEEIPHGSISNEHLHMASHIIDMEKQKKELLGVLKDGTMVHRLVKHMSPGVSYPPNRLIFAVFGANRDSIRDREVLNLLQGRTDLFRPTDKINFALNIPPSVATGKGNAVDDLSMSRFSMVKQEADYLYRFNGVRENIYEVLRYVPVHWMRILNLSHSIPDRIMIKYLGKKDLRSLKEYPRFIEIYPKQFRRSEFVVRRAVIWNPEAHGMTKEQATAYHARSMIDPNYEPTGLPEWFKSISIEY